jgi:outer membrane protein OmpA-like peptidoglycan-associated protein
MNLTKFGNTHNRQEATTALMKMSENEGSSFGNKIYEIYEKDGIETARKSLDMVSGAFLAEVLVMSARDENVNSLYSKLKTTDLGDGNFAVSPSSLRGAQRRGNPNRATRLIQNTFWTELSGSQLSLDHKDNSLLGNTKNNTMSLKAGALIAANKNTAVGFFLSGSNSEIKQEKTNWAIVNSFEGGFYAGLFEPNSEYKAHLSFGNHDYSTRRNIALDEVYKTNAEFSAFSIKGGFEAAHIAKTAFADFKPYAGLRFSMISNDEINESGAEGLNLRVDKNNYSALTGIAGLKLEKSQEGFNWYVKGEIGYLFAGNNAGSEFVMSFKDSQTKQSMNIRGLEIAPLTYGGGVGIDAPINETASLYADAQLSLNENIFYAQANVGMKVFFGQSKQMKQYQAQQRKLKAEQAEQEKKERQQKLDAQNAQIVAQKAELDKQKADLDMQKAQVQTEKQKLQDELRLQKELAAQRRQNAQKTFRLQAASFPANSARLSPQARANIRKMAMEVRKLNYKLITVEGHTDTSGNAQTNTILSQTRAQSVANELIRNGIPSAKVKFIGMGSSMPIADNITPAGRNRNRRAEVFVE